MLYSQKYYFRLSSYIILPCSLKYIYFAALARMELPVKQTFIWFVLFLARMVNGPNLNLTVKVKVKQSRNRPGLAQRVAGGLDSQISWHSAREGGDVSLTHRPPLPPGMFLVLIFTRGWVDPRAMVRSEGDVTEKSSDTTGNRSRDRPANITAA